MMKNPFTMFLEAQSALQQQEFQAQMNQEGFSSFYKFLDSFSALLRSFSDLESADVHVLLEQARRLFPLPGQFSPSWERIWIEYDEIYLGKCRVLSKIRSEDRDGEWQIIMDNPYTSQEVVCYPGLGFIEASYLYAYFSPQMEKNEYIRLQKVHTLIMDQHSSLSTETELSPRIDWD
jgi:hypothetical protein